MTLIVVFLKRLNMAFEHVVQTFRHISMLSGHNLDTWVIQCLFESEVRIGLLGIANRQPIGHLYGTTYNVLDPHCQNCIYKQNGLLI